jgi:hypothetical protein
LTRTLKDKKKTGYMGELVAWVRKKLVSSLCVLIFLFDSWGFFVQILDFKKMAM